MKNIIIAVALAALLGLGFYYMRSNSNQSGAPHAHEGGDPHSH